MSVLRLSSLLISYSSVGKSEQGLGAVSQTELLLLSRDPVLRAHQEPDLPVDLHCITCTYKGGKPGEAVGELSPCRRPQPGGTTLTSRWRRMQEVILLPRDCAVS